MAKEIIVRVTCDRHALKGEHVEGTTLPPIAMDKSKPRVLDLCAECEADVYAPLVELLTEAGRYEDSGRKTRRPKQPATQPDPQPSSPTTSSPTTSSDPVAYPTLDGEYLCPDDPTCPKAQPGNGFKKSQGLGAHRARTHGYRRPTE